MDKLSMFGIKICACDLPDATRQIIDAAINKRKVLVVTPNVDHVVTIKKNPDVARVYRNAELVFADGMPLVWLSRFLPGRGLPARVTGADLLIEVCSAAAVKGLSIGFLGGAEGVAETAARELQKRYPGLKVAGTYSPPWGFDVDNKESEKIVDLCREWRADIICLAFGAPKQELWGGRHLERLECGPVLCFGAAIDFVAGTYTRAPACFQKCGMEWVWRLFQEPRRMFKRYLIRDSVFFVYAASEVVRAWFAFLMKNESI